MLNRNTELSSFLLVNIIYHIYTYQSYQFEFFLVNILCKFSLTICFLLSYLNKNVSSNLTILNVIIIFPSTILANLYVDQKCFPNIFIEIFYLLLLLKEMNLKFKFRWPIIIIVLISVGFIWNIYFYYKLIIIINFLILLLIVENKYEEVNLKT